MNGILLEVLADGNLSNLPISSKMSFRDENNRSLVLKLSYRQISFLFTGDIESKAERSLLSLGEKLRSTILKVPHHGSRYSSSLPFLQMVFPQVAVFSARSYGKQRFPHPMALARYQKLPCQIYRTDLDGAITIETDGTAFKVKKDPRAASVPAPKAENALKKIFILLRAQTGHDFSQYKPSTIHRRIERRMAVHQIETMDGYVKYLQQTPPEVEALFRDLLIGVTNFFRDPEAFKALEEQVIPKLFAGKPAERRDPRLVAGMLHRRGGLFHRHPAAERLEALKQSFKVQVFATDIDSQAIATARAGLYPASIAADISPERLARFFAAEPDGSAYRIHKGIRDMLVFSEQNVIKDPPFSKLDLISCRNLLIYMGGDLQKKLIPLFHYALNPGGFLFLGTSETVGEFGDLFAVLDRKSKLYQRKEDFHGAQRAALGRFLPPMTAMDAALPRAAGKTAVPGKLPLRELTEQALLQQVAPAGALVNGQGDILYLHGRTGLYLEPAPGEAGINNILKMAREGLRRDLTTALHKAARDKRDRALPGPARQNQRRLHHGQPDRPPGGGRPCRDA